MTVFYHILWVVKIIVLSLLWIYAAFIVVLLVLIGLAYITDSLIYKEIDFHE